MALVTYRVWYGCRVDNVAYKRGIVVQLDDTSASVQYNVSKGRLRPVADELAGDTVTSATILDNEIVNADVASDAAIAATKIAGTAVTQADTGTVTSGMIANDTIVDADINSAAAIAATKISGTALVASTVDAKGDLLTGTADNTVARLAVGSDGQHLVADSSATAGVAYQSIGNLLTENQASVETDTTGFVGQNSDMTLESSTDFASTGSRSLKATRVDTIATGAVLNIRSGDSAATGGGTLPVTAGQTYTFSYEVYAPSVTPSMSAWILWWQSDGTTAASTASVQGTAVTAGASWKRVLVTAVAPSDAAFASLYARSASGAISDVIYYDKFSFHAGAGGLWQLPSAGTPIANLGIKSDAAGVYVWNDTTSAWTAV